MTPINFLGKKISKHLSILSSRSRTEWGEQKKFGFFAKKIGRKSIV